MKQNPKARLFLKANERFFGSSVLEAVGPIILMGPLQISFKQGVCPCDPPDIPANPNHSVILALMLEWEFEPNNSIFLPSLALGSGHHITYLFTSEISLA